MLGRACFLQESTWHVVVDENNYIKKVNIRVSCILRSKIYIYTYVLGSICFCAHLYFFSFLTYYSWCLVPVWY